MTVSRTGLGPLFEEKQQPLVDRVTLIVRQLIVDGRLRPGDTVSVSELATDLGVSHSPVREAVQRLAAQGLIELRPGRTGVVAALDLGDLQDIYKLRRFIEVDAATRAAPDLTDADLRELQVLFDRMLAFKRDVDGEGFWTVHDAFHRVLMRVALTPRMETILASLWHASERYFRLVGPAPEHDVAEFHRGLLDLAGTRDGAALGEALRLHLELSGQRIAEGLEEILAR